MTKLRVFAKVGTAGPDVNLVDVPDFPGIIPVELFEQIDDGQIKSLFKKEYNPGQVPPVGQLDPDGILLPHPITGNKVLLTTGNDHRNGQRYSVNHHFLNYMMIGYFHTGKGQKVIEMKTDGPNHGGCTGGNQCCWAEPDVDIADGQCRISSEWPHPQNHPSAKAPSAKKVGSLKEKWIGFSVSAFDNGDGHRRYQTWLDTDPFDANGKPKNGWVLGLDEVDTGQITNPTLCKRQIPINFNKGLEAEVRMHGATNHDCQIKFAKVYELVLPVV